MADNNPRLPEPERDDVVSEVEPEDIVRGPYDDEDAALAALPDGPTPEGEQVDLPGEMLASDRLPDEVDEYEVDVDEAEAEELGADEHVAPLTTDQAGEPVDDPEQLAEAEQVANVAPSTRPRKRKQVRAEAAAQAAEDTSERTALVRETTTTAASLRPRRKGASVAQQVVDADDDALVATGRRPRGTAVVAKKDHATPRQHTRSGVVATSGEAAPSRIGPRSFLGQVVAELRKVVWPTGNQLAQNFIVVLVFVLFIIALVFGLDTLFGYLVLKIFG